MPQVMNVTSGGYNGPIGTRTITAGDFPLRPMTAEEWFQTKVDMN